MDEEQLREIIREEIEKHQQQDQEETNEIDLNDRISRRKFLKLAGLGAGSLALSSSVSAIEWTPLSSSGGGGGGGSQTLSEVLSNGNDINGNDIVDSGTTVWDTSAGTVPQTQLGGPPSSISNYPLGSSDISDTAVQDIIGNSLGSGLTYDDSEGLIKRTREGPNPYDAAQSFEEPDVSISHTQTRVSNGSVELEVSSGTSVNPSTTGRGPQSETGSTGVEVVPNTNIGGVRVTINSTTDNFGEVHLIDTNKNILDTTTGSFAPGDVVDLKAPMTAGTSYAVVVYDGGNSYDRGFAGASGVTSTDIDVPAGALFAHPDESNQLIFDSDYFNSFSEVQALTPAKSGTAIIEWGAQPADIYSWDVATFTATEDGESVEVDVVGISRTTSTNSFYEGSFTNNFASEIGVIFEPNNDLNYITATLGRDNVYDYSDTGRGISLYDDATGDLLEEKSGTFPASSEVTFNRKFEAGKRYRLLAAKPSDNVLENNKTLPITGTNVDIVDGWRGGVDSSTVYAFESIKSDSTSVTGTLKSNISRNEDISDISASQEIALRADLSRSDTSNNPALDSAYRSWKV